MRVLALDAALNHTGWCLGDENGNIEKAGLFKVDAGLEFQQKLIEIGKWLLEFIEKDSVELVGIEGCYMYKNPKTLYNLSAVHGCIMACAGLKDVNVVTLAPSYIKRHCTGKGNASKEEVADAVLNLPEIAGSPELQETIANTEQKYRHDITDAIAIYTALARMLRTSNAPDTKL